MGVVYKARQKSLNRTVALKMILSANIASSEAIRRFHNEAEAAAKLDHPGIVPVYEVGEIDGQHFLSMGFITGDSLADQVKKRGPLPTKEAARVTLAIAEAVHFAHSRNVIHRDLKPANILLDAQQPRVTDFGLAKVTDVDSGLTATGQVMGTPSYMPPEQAAGNMDRVGPLADVYSLGGILYFLLTGHAPFEGANVLETLKQVTEQDPVSPRQHNKAIDADLATICLKCLQKETHDRYRSASELAADLQRYLNGEPVFARPVGRLNLALRWTRRNPISAAVLAISIVSLLSGITYWQTRPAWISINVVPSDANAVVTLGDRELPLVEGHTLAQWQPGQFQLRVEAPGYASDERQVILARGRDNRLQVQIELQSKYGFVTLDDAPAGMEVTVFGANDVEIHRGTTPYHSPRLPSGPYKLRITHELYSPEEIAVKVPVADRTFNIPGIAPEPIAETAGLVRLIRIRGRIDQPLRAPWSFDKTPLSDALEQIRRREEVEIAMDELALKKAGILRDRPVTFAKKKGTLRSALQELLEPMGAAYIPEFKRTGLRIAVTSQSAAEEKLQTIVYPIGDLATTLRVRILPGLGVDITDIFTDSIDGGWSELGRSGQKLEFIKKRQVVSARVTWDVHDRLYDWLLDARGDKSSVKQPTVSVSTVSENAQPASLVKLRQQWDLLQTPVASWEFVDYPLSEVLEFITEATDFQFLIDKVALEEEGFGTDEPITLTYKKGTLQGGLKQILGPLGLTVVPIGKPDTPKFKVTTEIAAEDQVQIVFFPVQNLMPKPSDFTTLRDAIFESTSGPWLEVEGEGGRISLVPQSNSITVRAHWWLLIEVDAYLREARRSRKSRP